MRLSHKRKVMHKKGVLQVQLVKRPRTWILDPESSRPFTHIDAAMKRLSKAMKATASGFSCFFFGHKQHV